MTVLHDSRLEALLARLHDESDAQAAKMRIDFAERQKDQRPIDADERKHYLADKMVALDRDKAEFCYQLCRAKNARRVVEIGTSHGVSTLYLAAAIRDNLGSTGGKGLVTATEYEREKARVARGHFEEAGLARHIELREGDLRETLASFDSPVDFMLVDIWIPMARPALELVAPHLKPGAIVICDNTEQYRVEYADYFSYINDPANGFRTMTLPFAGGLEMSVHCDV
ncbi:MAG: class I SAM-dependent methyltransferase [Rhizomicrobium sp.]